MTKVERQKQEIRKGIRSVRGTDDRIQIWSFNDKQGSHVGFLVVINGWDAKCHIRPNETAFNYGVRVGNNWEKNVLEDWH